ncbi:PREDICTED: uncharacterized protein LOC109172474 [Ipomoea nil]|uniref:uncharacterized protein LOC109172474 n=1 Tax=Ipomoea nil TaxID=35883 RepID=UPI0009015583|nr:PREDICTED: uncharacterized protein LOC109172474 [Ipomoea nil]
MVLPSCTTYGGNAIRPVWEFKLGIPRRVHAIATAALDAWRAAVVPPARQHGTVAAAGDAGQVAAGSAARTEERLRCSFDAGYVAASGMGVFGLILQRADGGFVAAKNGPLPTCQSPFMAEAFACKETLSWLIDRGVTEVVLRTDCSNLCHALTTTATEFRSYDGVVVSACRDLLS